jgi:hypothetical protein
MVVESSERKDDLVRDMIEVLTSFWARRYGRRSARHQAQKAMRAMGNKILSLGEAQGRSAFVLLPPPCRCARVGEDKANIPTFSEISPCTRTRKDE